PLLSLSLLVCSWTPLKSTRESRGIATRFNRPEDPRRTEVRPISLAAPASAVTDTRAEGISVALEPVTRASAHRANHDGGPDRGRCRNVSCKADCVTQWGGARPPLPQSRVRSRRRSGRRRLA